MKSKGIDLWEILFYVALAIFMLWAIAKSTGLISTPEWLAVGVPALSAGVAIGSFYQKFRMLATKIDDIDAKVNAFCEKCPHEK